MVLLFWLRSDRISYSGSVDDSKPQVILLAYYYPPHREIGSLRPFRFRKYLERLGYRCHVITASPQNDPAPEGVTVIPDTLGEIWEGESKGRLSLNGYVELLMRQFQYPGDFGMLWARAAAAECRRIAAANRGVRFVVFSSYPPVGSLLAGFHGGSERMPWICDFRDPLFGLVDERMPWYVRWWSGRLEKRVFHKAAAIVANTEAAAAVWRERYPWALHKIHAIYNGFDPEESPHPRTIPERDHKLIVHAGGLYEGRNPAALIEGLARLRSQGAAEAMRAKVLLLGAAVKLIELNPTLYEQAQRDGWLELRATVPRPEAQRVIEEADGLLIVQPHTGVQVPGKLFEYVCVGRPVLAIVPRSSPIEHILTNAAVPSVCIYPDDPADTSDRKVLDYLRLPNTAAPINDWFRSNFSGEVQAEALAGIIEQVARGIRKS